jgi:hypothetical protein
MIIQVRDGVLTPWAEAGGQRFGPSMTATEARSVQPGRGNADELDSQRITAT